MKHFNWKKLSVGSIITALNTLAITVMIKAADIKADFLEKGGANEQTGQTGKTDMFSGLNTNLQNLGASAYNTLKIIAIIAGCIGLAGAAFMFASGSAAKRDEAKTKVLYVLIAIVLIFSVVTLISIAAGVGDNITNTATS